MKHSICFAYENATRIKAAGYSKNCLAVVTAHDVFKFIQLNSRHAVSSSQIGNVRLKGLVPFHRHSSVCPTIINNNL